MRYCGVPLYFKKDGPGPVMVRSTLCPAVHILGSQNVYSRAEHYCPWAVFSHSSLILSFSPSVTVSLSSNSVSVSFTPTAVIRKMHEKERSLEAASPKSTPTPTPTPSTGVGQASSSGVDAAGVGPSSASSAGSAPLFTSGSQVLAGLSRLTPSSISTPNSSAGKIAYEQHFEKRKPTVKFCRRTLCRNPSSKNQAQQARMYGSW